MAAARDAAATESQVSVLVVKHLAARHCKGSVGGVGERGRNVQHGGQLGVLHGLLQVVMVQVPATVVVAMPAVGPWTKVEWGWGGRP